MTLISGLSISKGHGTDGIMAKSLKVAANELSFPLVTIFNFSWNRNDPESVETGSCDSCL